MTPEQKAALLKSILLSAGLVKPDATDVEVQQALAMARQQDPAGTQAALAAGGYPVTPWLTYLGLAAGALAIYLVWDHYQGTRKLGVIERPESEPEDYRPQLRGFSKSLGAFRGSGRNQLKCMVPPKKYQFEPEIRLEGHRARRSKSKGARR